MYILFFVDKKKCIYYFLLTKKVYILFSLQPFWLRLLPKSISTAENITSFFRIVYRSNKKQYFKMHLKQGYIIICHHLWIVIYVNLQEELSITAFYSNIFNFLKIYIKYDKICLSTTQTHMYKIPYNKSCLHNKIKR